MKFLNIFLFDLTFCSKIYGNIFSDSHQERLRILGPLSPYPSEISSLKFKGPVSSWTGRFWYVDLWLCLWKVIETMWIPAAQGQEESTSCIFVEHRYVFKLMLTRGRSQPIKSLRNQRCWPIRGQVQSINLKISVNFFLERQWLRELSQKWAQELNGN